MSEKRFTIIETQIGRVIRDNETDINTGDIGIIFDWLNELYEENTHLRNDNLKAFALLGDIRALARGLLQQDNLDTIIEKIDKFEKEIME